MRLLTIALLLVLPICLSAQFQLGWRTDANAGINSALINPAFPGRTDYSWDFNLLEGTAFLANNYGYLRNTSAIDLFRLRNAEPTFIHARDIAVGEKPDDNALVYEFFDEEEYYLETMVSVLGPSFSMRVAPMARIGLFTRFQMMAMATDVEQDVGYDAWQQIGDDVLFNMERLRLIGAAWTELGLNYNQGINTNSGILTFGVSVRRLWGERSVYAINNERFELSKVTDYVGLRGIEFDVDAAYTNNVVDTEASTTPTGKGWGFDFGFLYQIDQGEGFYRWEFGGSVLNLGRINFTDGQLHNYNSTELREVISAEYEQYDIDDGADALIQQFSEDIFGDPLGSFEADNFKLGLPTTLTVHASYHFTESVKVDANLFSSLASFGPRLTQKSVLALTPRIDRYWWGVGVPVSLYAGHQLRLGLAARLGPFFMGTDQLGAFTQSGELSGGGFYFGVKLHPLGLGSGERKNKIKGRRRGGKDVECYKF
jgi:hypothetical protein